MSVYTTTVTRYFVKCDWCGKQEEITNNKPGHDYDVEFQRELPVGWRRDWDVVRNSREHPPTYCSEVHMDRARHVAALRALP